MVDYKLLRELMPWLPKAQEIVDHILAASGQEREKFRSEGMSLDCDVAAMLRDWEREIKQ